MLQAAKELAQRDGRTAGQVLSELARHGLSSPGIKLKARQRSRGGVPLLPSRGEIVTLEKVRRLMDQQGI